MQQLSRLNILMIRYGRFYQSKCIVLLLVVFWMYWLVCFLLPDGGRTSCLAKEILVWSSLVSDWSKYWKKKLTYPFVIFTLWTQLCFFEETKFKIYGWGFGCFFPERECMRDQSTCSVVTEVFGQASCNSGQILSFDWLLFWALHLI